MLTNNKLSISTRIIPPVLPKANQNSTALSQRKEEAARAIEIYNSSFSRILPGYIGDNGKIITIRDGEHLKHLIINEGFNLKQAQAPGCYYLSRGLEWGGNLDEIIRMLNSKPDSQRSVFISYCWSSQKDIAIEIEKEFTTKGYLVIRDENELRHGDNLYQFMDLIDHNKMDYVVPIISSDYLKSDNCMYEVIQIMKRFGKNTTLPCIIDSGNFKGTGVYTSAGRQEILEHWENRLKEAVKAGNIGEQKRLKKVGEDLSSFMKYISRQLNAGSSQLGKENYKTLLDLVDKAEIENGSSPELRDVRKLLDHAKYDFDVEEYLTAEEGYKKAIELLKQLKDTSPTGKQLNAIAYAGYAECLKHRDSPEHPKFLRIAKNFGHVATNKPIEIDTNKLMIAIKRAEENSDISFLVTMLEKNIPNPGNEQAAGALMHLARNTENKVTIAKAGAIPLLTAMLEKNIPIQCKEYAAAALSWLALNTENKVTCVIIFKKTTHSHLS